MPGRSRPDPDGDEDQEARWIRRLLRTADEMVRRRNESNGKKGGERAEPGERPVNDRKNDEG